MVAAIQRRGAVRGVMQRIGSPWVVTVLGAVVVIGVLAVFVTSMRAAWADRTQARVARTASVVTGELIDTLVALQNERGVAELFLVSEDPAVRTRIETTIAATDREIAQLADVWRMSGSELAGANPPTVGDFLVAAGSLAELRNAVGWPAEESAFEAYVALVDTLLEAERSLRALAATGESLQLHNALSALLRSTEMLGRERALVARVIGRGEDVSADEQVRLSLLEREVQVGLDAAGALLGRPAADRLDRVAAGPQTTQASALLRAIGQGTIGGEHSIAPAAWFDEATVRLGALLVIVNDVNMELLARADAQLARSGRGLLVRAGGFGSLLVVAILAALAAIATSRERARALAEYSELADGLLRWFLPERFPDLPALELAARYVPSSERTRAGGDWYDTWELSRSQVALVIGDVSGHGPHAGAQMAELRNLLRGQSIAYPKSPADQIELLEATVSDIDLFATVLFGILDTDTGTFTYTRAGHPPPLLAAEGVSILDGGKGPPLGAGPAPTRGQSQVTVPPGGVLLLYTDGLVESRRRDVAAGIERLAAAVPDPAADLEAITDLVLASRPDPTNEDDIAVLTVRYLGSG